NYIMRADLADVPKNIDAFRCAGGYFSEKTIDMLDEIAPIISNKYQTLAYCGIDKKDLQEFVIRNRLTGLDRIVPFGETTAFALTWDGYNLIDSMSRVCSIL
ncbi:MAG: acyl-CoA reductase, partial [Bacteroidaceae bacterium]|nr:acyl-CoA reductase [Bacteroidaceae bacterium]